MLLLGLDWKQIEFVSNTRNRSHTSSFKVIYDRHNLLDHVNFSIWNENNVVSNNLDVLIRFHNENGYLLKHINMLSQFEHVATVDCTIW